MDLRKMVSKWLKKNKYDGLCNHFDCGCGLDDFMPCNECSAECVPAKEVKCLNCGAKLYSEVGGSVENCEGCPIEETLKEFIDKKEKGNASN